jgi:hypothetical protein
MVEPYFHIGILVKDLDAAMERFHKVLQVSFRTPRVVQVSQEYGRGPSVADLRFTYSHQGPPYYELIEAHDTGIFSLDRGEGPHHIGMWALDGQERLKDLQGRGLRPEIVQYSGDGQLIFAYFERADLCGTRIEILDASQRAIHEAWMSR